MRPRSFSSASPRGVRFSNDQGSVVAWEEKSPTQRPKTPTLLVQPIIEEEPPQDGAEVGEQEQDEAQVELEEEEEILEEWKPYHPLSVFIRQTVGILAIGACISGAYMAGIFFAFWIATLMNIKLFYTSPLIYFVAALVTLMLSIVLKWVLVGKQRPRFYRLWSWEFVPWWIVEHLHQFTARQYLLYLTGSPFIVWYYRLLGAKIGKGVCIETELISNPDLIVIGDHTVIGRQALLRTHTEKDTIMMLDNIVIGPECTVGDMAVLMPASRMERGATLDVMSLLTENRFLPAHTLWQGSPAKHVHDLKPLDKPPKSGNFLGAVFSFIGLLWLFASLVVSLVPFLYLSAYFLSRFGTYIGSVLTPVGLALSLVLQGLFLVISKWIVLGRLKEGTYPIYGQYYYRRWLANKFATLEPISNYLSGTVFAAGWLRLWGAKVGGDVEVSTAVILDRDLLNIAEGVFLAENVMQSGAIIECGSLVVKKLSIGHHTFIGNTTYIGGGTTLGANCTIGALSCMLPDNDYAEGTTWVGSPPVQIQSYKDVLEQQALADVSVAKRIFVDVIGLPYLLIVNAIFQLPAVLIVAQLSNYLPFLQLRALSPYLAALAYVVLFLIIFLVKLFTGKQTPNTAYHHYSMYVRIRRTLFKPSRNMNYISPIMQGTFLINWYYRLLGAKIGSRVYIDSMGLADWDLLHIGDDVIISYNAHLQGHTAENMVFKFRTVEIKNGCNIGPASVVLPGVVVEDGVTLGGLTLAMKGENFAKFESVYGESIWEGTPARACKDPPFVLKNVARSMSVIKTLSTLKSTRKSLTLESPLDQVVVQ